MGFIFIVQDLNLKLNNSQSSDSLSERGFLSVSSNYLSMACTSVRIRLKGGIIKRKGIKIHSPNSLLNLQQQKQGVIAIATLRFRMLF